MINRTDNRENNKGAALLLFVMLFMFISLAVSLNLSRSVYSGLLTARLMAESKQSHFASEALLEDVTYRNIAGLNVDTVESKSLYGASITATTSIDTVDWIVTITAGSNNNDLVRSSQSVLAVGEGASFNFGLQSGTGGIVMTNSSSVVGNIFSNGEILGAGSSLIKGDAISGGPDGFLQGIHATGSAWAHTIDGIEVDGDAYYTVEAGASVVHGDRNFPSPDQATATMPIPDSVVQSWEDDITDSGTVIASTDPECLSGTYLIDVTTEIGNVKIECNLEVQKNGTDLILTGPVWVAGDITFNSGPEIIASSSVGARSVQMIAHNPADTVTSSRIIVNNATDFYGSGDPKSFVLLLSMNDDGEEGGSNVAIDLNNAANGDILLYAEHGIVELSNGISLKEVTGWRIDMANNTEVIYESGLVNLLFTSGPGGGFTITDWAEL